MQAFSIYPSPSSEPAPKVTSKWGAPGLPSTLMREVFSVLHPNLLTPCASLPCNEMKNRYIDARTDKPYKGLIAPWRAVRQFLSFFSLACFVGDVSPRGELASFTDVRRDFY